MRWEQLLPYVNKLFHEKNAKYTVETQKRYFLLYMHVFLTFHIYVVRLSRFYKKSTAVVFFIGEVCVQNFTVTRFITNKLCEENVISFFGMASDCLTHFEHK